MDESLLRGLREELDVDGKCFILVSEGYSTGWIHQELVITLEEI